MRLEELCLKLRNIQANKIRRVKQVMNKKKWNIIYFAIIGTVVLVGVISMLFAPNLEGNVTEYKCDVKNFRLSTTIEVECNGTEIGEVKGNILSLVTDPLTMYSPSGNKIAYAGDAYHFIAQDSHGIYVNGSFTADMVGQIELIGEEYKIYASDEKLVAKVKFNGPNTSGEMRDIDGTLVAMYSSNFFFKDFTVSISDKCTLDHNTVLMIMCSYYSDQAYDNS